MAVASNVVGKINMILMNVPEDVDDLTKVRYFYKKLGNLFNYDLKVIINEELACTRVDFDNIEQYQTCLQITEIMQVVLSNLNPTVKSRIIARKLSNNGPHKQDHVANEVEFTDSVTGVEYKLLLDLTLDLFRIQAGMQTKQFAYTTDATGSHDIISLRECEEMDKRLGFVNGSGYKDESILKVAKDLSIDERPLREKLTTMWNRLGENFDGTQEAKQYFTALLLEIFPRVDHKSYNLYYGDINECQFASLFIINNGEVYVLVDDKLGMVFSSKEKITNMLKIGWKTTSKSLKSTLGIEQEEVEEIKMKI